MEASYYGRGEDVERAKPKAANDFKENSKKLAEALANL